jgi:hypothetical protein
VVPPPSASTVFHPDGGKLVASSKLSSNITVELGKIIALGSVFLEESVCAVGVLRLEYSRQTLPDRFGPPDFVWVNNATVEEIMRRNNVHNFHNIAYVYTILFENTKRQMKKDPPIKIFPFPHCTNGGTGLPTQITFLTEGLFHQHHFPDTREYAGVIKSNG